MIPARKTLLSLLLPLLTLTVRAETDNSLESFFKKLKAGEKQTVVTFGTSLTEHGAWVPLMQAWFEEKFPGQVKVVNGGGSGQNSDWGVTQVEKKVLSQSPNLVFIEFSYNDAHVKFHLTPEHCKQNLETIISTIRKKDPTTAIVLQTMNAPWNPPAGKGFQESETNRPKIEAFNENYRTVAKALNLPLVDSYPVWLKLKESDFPRYQTLVPDGSHPSKAGSQEVTWPNIQALLEKAST